MDKRVADGLSLYRQGRCEDAFCLLSGAGQEITELVAAFRGESDGPCRAFLVEVIWQHRQQSAVPFLTEALSDPDDAVWRQALDGLVTLASPESLAALRIARESRDDTFREWIDEAIEQVEGYLTNQ